MSVFRELRVRMRPGKQDAGSHTQHFHWAVSVLVSTGLLYGHNGGTAAGQMWRDISPHIQSSSTLCSTLLFNGPEQDRWSLHYECQLVLMLELRSARGIHTVLLTCTSWICCQCCWINWSQLLVLSTNSWFPFIRLKFVSFWCDRDLVSPHMGIGATLYLLHEWFLFVYVFLYI